MYQFNNRLHIALLEREKNEVRRSLKVYSDSVDFFSNDYLGLAKNEDFHQQILEELNDNPSLLFGSTGARLISGNSDYLKKVEEFIAKEHQTEAALFFSSGYNANLALFSAISKRNDVVLVDENIHRSVHDGCKLSNARKLKFKHNDLAHLEKLLQKVDGNCFVAVESLYSMDGDFAPLIEIVALCQHYNAVLIVDEAHAFGVFGYGLIHQLGLQHQVFATIITYGKAMGMSGAAIVADQLLIDYLINYASPFIYTTAFPNSHIVGIKRGYHFINQNNHLQEKLQQNILHFRASSIISTSDKISPIQVLKFKNKSQLLFIKNELEKLKINTFAVFAPTVAVGKEPLRICLHAFNTQEEINELTRIIKENE